MYPVDTQTQINQILREIVQLTDEKGELEKKVLQGEDILDVVDQLLKDATTGVDEYEGGIARAASELPGVYGHYFERKIKDAIIESGIREMDQTVSGTRAKLRNKVMDFDDQIKTCISRIAEKNTLIENLKNAADVLVDAMSGGE